MLNLKEFVTPAVWDQLVTKLLGYLPKIVSGLLIILAFWIAANLVRGLINRVGRIRRVDSDLVALLARIAKIAILVFGLVMGLGTLGLDVSALIAGLGLTGFALGFALKDIISNALAGILIIAYEPFRRHDTIWITGMEGKVLEINLRYTVLEAQDKQIFLPNATLFTNAVTVKRSGQPA